MPTVAKKKPVVKKPAKPSPAPLQKAKAKLRKPLAKATKRTEQS